VTLHSFDTYLAVNPGFVNTARALGGSTSTALSSRASVTAPLLSLEPLRSKVGTVAVSMLDYGGPPQNCSLLIGRFQHRVPGPVRVLAAIGRGNPRADSWLNHPGATLKNPENVWGVYDHYARSRPGFNDVEMPFEVLRVNHYVDMFAPRCSSRFLHCDVKDSSLLRAVLPAVCGRLGATAACNIRQGCSPLQ